MVGIYVSWERIFTKYPGFLFVAPEDVVWRPMDIISKTVALEAFTLY